MKRFCIVFLVFALLGLAAASVQAQTGCPADSPTAVAINPTKVRAELPDHTRIMLDGDPATTGYILGWYAEGARAPTPQTPIAKAAFTVVAGTTICYEATLPALTGIPIGQKYIAVLKTLRGTEESAWSTPSNPFGYASAGSPVAADEEVAVPLPPQTRSCGSVVWLSRWIWRLFRKCD